MPTPLRLLVLACLACFGLVQFAPAARAQVVPQVVPVCAGESAALQGPPGFVAYFWTPEELIQEPGRVRANTVPLNDPTRFEVRSIRPIGDNLIANPTFDDGNDGFTSAYALKTGTRSGPGTYAVVSDPRTFDAGYEDCPDSKEPLTGQFLVADGGTVGQRVWCQEVAVKPNTSYSFVFYFASMTAGNPARLAARIDGEPLGRPVTAERITCVWRSLFRIFDTGDRTSIEVCVTSESQGSVGNDFAIDRLSLNELDEPRVDSFLVVPQAPTTEPTLQDIPRCPGDRFQEYGLDLGVGESGIAILKSRINCDSAVQFTVVASDSSRFDFLVDDLCGGEAYSIDGVDYRRDTTVCIPYTSLAGCDSIVCTELQFFDADDLAVVTRPPGCGGRASGGSISVVAAGGLAPYTYAWADNPSTDSVRANLAVGSYELSVTDARGCTVVRAILLEEAPPISVADLFVLDVRCAGEANGVALLTAFGGTGELAITVTDTGSTALPFDELPVGTYTVTVEDSVGCSRDSVVTIGGPQEVGATLEGDTLVRLGVSGRWEAKVFGDDDVQDFWTFNGVAIDSLVGAGGVLEWRPSTEGLLEVTARNDNGCEDIASLFVRLQSSDSPFFPTAFSPNGDGINDRFSPAPDPAIEVLEDFVVYDRWGNLLYRERECPVSSPAGCGWDGRTLDLQPANVGVYIYHASLRLLDGSVLQRTGDVLLVTEAR